MNSYLRRILKESRHLPQPVQSKLVYNLRRILKTNLRSEEAGQATLRLVTFLSNRTAGDSTLFRHFKVSISNNQSYYYFGSLPCSPICLHSISIAEQAKKK